MPQPVTAKLPKPKSPDEFEDLALDVLNHAWGAALTRNGRSGQEQHGVDLYGTRRLEPNALIGVQCKNVASLSEGDIEAEVAKAEHFRPELAQYYFATSLDRDAKLQEAVRLLSKERVAKGAFPVDVIFWDDLVRELAGSSALVQKYYAAFSSLPLASPPAAPRRPWNAPLPPGEYLHRPEVDALKASLLAGGSQAIAVSGQHHRLGIQGMAGVGKTVLVAALAADPEVHRAFPGGVFWLTLGRTPEPAVGWQARLAEQLKGSPVAIDTPNAGKAVLRDLFASRPASLLILDDVWDTEHADPFNVDAPPSRVLITTRNREVAIGLGAEVRELNELTRSDALSLLASYAKRSVDALPKEAPEIVRECGELPLALAMAGSMLRGRPDDRWPVLLEQLKNAKLGYLEARLPDYLKHRNLLAAIEVSVQELSEEDRLRYFDFAIFPEDAVVPETVPQRLWARQGVDLAAAQRTVDKLVDCSLVRRDANGRLTLHDLQHDYVLARCGDIKSKHAQLVDAYRAVAPNGELHAVKPDGYFHEQIARHIMESEGRTALRALLFDFAWLAAKLKATNVNAVLSDFDFVGLASDKPARSVRDAIRLSAHILAYRPEELFSQLLARLRAAEDSELVGFCTQVEARVTPPCLVPILPSLTPPGPLLGTLVGHDASVEAVALSADGKTAVSGSDDATLKVWNVATGEVLRTLKGHDASVKAVALSADGKTAVSGSDDATLKVWDVATGEVLRTLEGRHGRVLAVALSADGKTAVSGSDETLKVWDAATGEVLRTLTGHHGRVRAVALSADGKTAVSGSGDATLKVWGAATGEELRTLKGHDDWVNAVALSADGKTAVSGSLDKTLKVWDVATGEEFRTLKGHDAWVNAVALSADGKTAVSGSDDNTLKVWDITPGEELRTLKGHDDWVNAVGLSADGKTAISGSGDATLKVWGLATGEVLRTLTGHQGRVRVVALSADGKTAVSGSHDKTLKMWDVTSGEVLRTFTGHDGLVLAVALSADGKTVVSSSAETTLKVWDVANGKLLRTLTGHNGLVNAVALSADGKTAVSGSLDKTLKVWDVATGEELRTLKGHYREALAVALSADGKTAVSGSYDKTLNVWDVATGACVASFTGEATFTCVALAASRVFAGDGLGRIHLFALKL